MPRHVANNIVLSLAWCTMDGKKIKDSLRANRLRSHKIRGPRRQDLVSELVLSEKCAKGLEGVDEYSHIFVIYWLHKV